MEGSIKKVNGHYQIALPWRDDNLNLPQNRLMAEKRLHGVQRKLLTDSDLCEKYCGKIGEYIASGFASPVPQNALVTPGKTFCVPHFSTPVLTNFRMVFGCSAKFDGVSLNDKLLHCPDLVTDLLGVLMRFRQETIAVVADINACFHQVFVEEEDRGAFRFLWFDKNDPRQPPVDYRMNVHIFGAAHHRRLSLHSHCAELLLTTTLTQVPRLCRRCSRIYTWVTCACPVLVCQGP